MKQAAKLLGVGMWGMMVLASCVGGRRNINYLQDGSLSNGSAKLFENRKFEYRIQVNDVLSIRVMGLDEATHRFFNVENQNGVAYVNDAALVNGFSVDKNGQVQLPTVGKIKVQGSTVGEAQDLVQRDQRVFHQRHGDHEAGELPHQRIGRRNLGMYFIYKCITILDALAMRRWPGGVRR